MANMRIGGGDGVFYGSGFAEDEYARLGPGDGCIQEIAVQQPALVPKHERTDHRIFERLGFMDGAAVSPSEPLGVEPGIRNGVGMIRKTHPENRRIVCIGLVWVVGRRGRGNIADFAVKDVAMAIIVELHDPIVQAIGPMMRRGPFGRVGLRRIPVIAQQGIEGIGAQRAVVNAG